MGCKVFRGTQPSKDTVQGLLSSFARLNPCHCSNELWLHGTCLLLTLGVNSILKVVERNLMGKGSIDRPIAAEKVHLETKMTQRKPKCTLLDLPTGLCCNPQVMEEFGSFLQVHKEDFSNPQPFSGCFNPTFTFVSCSG